MFSLWCPPSNFADGRGKSKKVFQQLKKNVEKMDGNEMYIL